MSAESNANAVQQSNAERVENSPAAVAHAAAWERFYNSPGQRHNKLMEGIRHRVENGHVKEVEAASLKGGQTWEDYKEKAAGNLPSSPSRPSV